ncbi:type IV toxin-antitoxin system AbiEi family antitoxin domain-containing protein [Pseudonocardia kongjuensis]
MSISLPRSRSGVLRRSELLADGLSSGEIERLRRAGRILRLRRGRYRDPADGPVTAEAAHALAARAAVGDVAADAVFGHVTAAVLLGLPVWSVPLRRVHIIRARGGGGRIRPALHVHPAPLPAEDVVELGALRLTSPARTVADLARTLPEDRALVIADGALGLAGSSADDGVPRPGATTRSEIAAVLDRQPRSRGRSAAARVVDFADGRSGSPGESLSRLGMRRAGLPAPILQYPVPGTSYRCDFGWPDHGIVGEFDGRGKYGRLVGPDADPETAGRLVWREKRREDRIRATGLIVVRWTWPDIGAPGPHGMVGLLHEALR